MKSLQKILIVAATKEEMVLEELPGNIDILITGVGMVSTTFSLTQKLQSTEYDLVINMGIGGAFNKNVKLGEVFQIAIDVFAELGAEDGNEFVPINKLGFLNDKESLQILAAKATHIISDLPKTNGITVNKVHGNESSIQKIMNRFGVDLVESMEGAAVFYVCSQLNIPCCQIRAISNYVEPRNKENWNIPLAIKNLNNTIQNIVPNLN